jgi:phosphate butyryltransferase
MIRNTSWNELAVGASASIERVCAVQDLVLFAHVSGNNNPLMLPSSSGAKDDASAAVAPSMWVGSLISAVLGNLLPGPGTLYRAQSLRFHRRIRVGDRLKVTVTCTAKGASPQATFETQIALGSGELICDGLAEIDAPTETIITPRRELPELIVDTHDLFARLVEQAKVLPPLRTAIVCPDDVNALSGAVLSAREGLILPVLIGNPESIARTAEQIGQDISSFPLIPILDHRSAAAKAVKMVHDGEVGAVMKGNIHSDELLAEVVKKDGGLRTNRRISHVFVMDVPSKDHFLFISDAAINIAPDLTTKVDICQNAIDLARACGVEKPRVGILSAVETVNINIPSTLDAAVLSKMAERGQIRGGIVDGPLAMDNAIDLEAARTKGIASLVAGHADILIVPNLESGNMLAKELTFVARAEAAGLVVGAKVPVILTSRADDDRSRLASCALAQLYNYWQREGKPLQSMHDTAAAAE